MLIIYFFVSMLASFAGAISGIGGGILLKPILDAIQTLSIQTINFLSVCTVLSMTVVSLFRIRKQPNQSKTGVNAFLGFGGVIGGIGGKALLNTALQSIHSDQLVGATQSLMLLFITIGVFAFIRSKSSITTQKNNNCMISALIGMQLGLISSFLGIGGGPLNLGVLYYFFSMDAKTASINSLFIIFLSQLANLVYSISSHAIPMVDPLILAGMIMGGITGGLLGNKVICWMSNSHVESFFQNLLLVISAVNIYNIAQFLR
ncbi:MAG: sulfite exporter TauE/SafE family protein [Veillonellaceae bacterium]|nr:sulfite exporter TauE/SafE family protein [Veillonellaceae bacterium]